MSGIDVREIKLKLRYPDSRQEDVTDAFMRGYTGAIEISNRAIEKLQTENERLRELVRWMYDRMDESCAVQHCYAPAPIDYDTLMQANARAYELGIEVDE